MALKKKPITLKNPVNPLDWNVPMVNPNGTPTAEFQRKWLQQAGANSTIVNVTTAAGVSAVLDIISSVVGSLLVRGTTAWQGLPPAGDATMFLNGAATPAYAKVKDTDLAVTDVTGNNVSITAHGFAPKAPNDATLFLNGLGAYSAPASGGGGAASIQDDGTTVFIALSDTDGQLVLDGSGDPIFAPEVFSPSSLPPGVYPSVADNSAAGVGIVGESLAASVSQASAIVLVNNTPKTVISITLTPGDWDVAGDCFFTGAATTTVGQIIGNLSEVTDTNDFTLGLYNTITQNGQVSFNYGNPSVHVGPVRKAVAAGTTKTIYLIAFAAFSVSTCSGYGFIRARLIR